MDIIICFSNAADADDLVERLSAEEPAANFQRVDALPSLFTTERSRAVAAVLLDPPQMDRHLALLRAHSLIGPVNFRSIVVSPTVDPLLMIKAIHFGFDDVLEARIPPGAMVSRIRSVVLGQETVHINPPLPRSTWFPACTGAPSGSTRRPTGESSSCWHWAWRTGTFRPF